MNGTVFQWIQESIVFLTIREQGPTPRSCHKICFDPTFKYIYLLGRYVDPESRPNVNLDCDFWVYSILKDSWTCISQNTAVIFFKY